MCLKKNDFPCVSLVGMAGAGKTTIASRLANTLDWAFIDTDNMVEALYAARLQDITDAFARDVFLDIECEIICSIKAGRCIIATGGSIVYRKAAIEHLATLGPIVHIHLSLEKITERIQRNPERGLVIAPGQTLEDIYNERLPLYEKAASIRCDSENHNPDQCVHTILDKLYPYIPVANNSKN